MTRRDLSASLKGVMAAGEEMRREERRRDERRRDERRRDERTWRHGVGRVIYESWKGRGKEGWELGWPEGTR